MANTNYGFNGDMGEKAKTYAATSPPNTFSEPIRAEPRNLTNVETGLPANNESNDGSWGYMDNLTEKKLRIGFIRKVYLIVTAQLIFTFGFVCIFVFVQPVKTFAQSSNGLICYIVSYVLFVGLLILAAILDCMKKLRTVPWNYMILFGITITMTYMLGMISAYHDVDAVLIAIAITLFITVGVTLFAMQTKYDLTSSCWLLIFMLVLALVGWGIGIGLCFAWSKPLQGVYGGVGALLMALFLAIDTQMIIGNKKFRYDSEDYINAALQLYLDICYIFLYILQLVGAAKK